MERFAMAMNDGDDKLLRRLGALAKDQDGGLGADELAELEREAASDPNAKALLEAARPLSDDAQDRIAGNLAKQMGGAVVRPARWRSRAGAIAGALALAAGIAVFVSRSGPDAVPLYALDASGAANVRGPSPAGSPCVLRASALGSFEVVARPHDRVDGAIGAHAFLVRTGGAVEPFPTSIETSPQGSVRVFDENRRL